jgi:hypothetical protein
VAEAEGRPPDKKKRLNINAFREDRRTCAVGMWFAGVRELVKGGPYRRGTETNKEKEK